MRGLTLIEILIVIFIISIVLLSGFSFLTGFYYQFLLDGEKELFKSLIKKVRIEAMDNLYSLPRGLYFSSSSYVVFSGGSYSNRNSQYDLIYPRNSQIKINFPYQEIVFNNLSGTTTASGTIELSIFNKKTRIIINNEGLVEE